MNILFIHQNFPGQFLHWSDHLAQQPGHRVVALSLHDNPAPQGVQVRQYRLLRGPAEQIHPLLGDLEPQVLRAEACAAAALQLKHEGFTPDLIIAHPGWGESLFIKDVFPHARLVVYCEYFYAAEGRDVGFDPEDPPFGFQKTCKLRLRNTANLHSLEMADAAIAPTQWQKSTFPRELQHKIQVIHDGINYAQLKPKGKVQIRLATQAGAPRQAEHCFETGDEVLTYVARNLESVRGFHVFMRALPRILQRRPKAHAIIVGGEGLSYGPAPASGNSWKQHMLDELDGQLDLGRVHFVGKIPYPQYVNLLHVSKAHAYWTTPFVLSWSLLEAAAAGTPLLASATPPVEEFASELGITLFPYFAAEQIADQLSDELARPTRNTRIGQLQRLSLEETTRLRTTLTERLMAT